MRAGPFVALCLCAAVAAQDDAARAPAVRFPQTPLETRSLAAADLDGDGDLDLVLGNVGQTVLWLNQGHGGFAPAPADAVPHQCFETNGIAARDFDGDGDLDLFLANGGWSGGQSCLWLNDGHGRFADGNHRIPRDYAWNNSVVADDFDGDGDVDLIAARFTQSVMLLNDGRGWFTVAEGRLPQIRTATAVLAAGDFDGDGRGDLALGDFLYERNRLWYAAGGGVFADATQRCLPHDSNDTNAIAVGDVDGDGDLDIVWGNGRLGGEQSRLYRNDGRGVFRDVTAHQLPTRILETHAVALVDVDADGDLDLLLGNAAGPIGAQNELWLNDGRGSFTAAPDGALPAIADRTLCLLVADLDGDGRPEVVVGNGREGGELTTVLQLPLPALVGASAGRRADR